MITPKEKAEQLIEKYVDIQSELEETTSFYWDYAKKCALITVDEILSINNERMYQLTGVKENFYKEVKLEINKL